MRKIGKKIYELRYLLIILSVCACYAGILYNQTMPFAEGWYSYYAKCINRGEVVYKDFDYLFTPLYIFFIALITKIFGYKVIILRIVGIIFFCLIGTFVYLSLKELFNEEIAVIATITSVMYMQSEVVQVFYDYVRMMDIFSCAATYFLIKAIKNDDRKKYFILAGIATSLFILTKQNMGLLFWIYSIILICSVSLVLRRSVKEKLIYFITGSIVPIFITIIFMLINGSLIPFFNQTGGEAVAAKGGILPILFNWIINNMSSFINTSKFSIICLACIIVSAIIKKKDEKNAINKQWLRKSEIYLFGILCIISFIVFAKVDRISKLLDGHTYLSPYSIFLIIIPIFIYYVINVIIDAVNNKEISNYKLLYITITGAYFAISWGCGMSGGLSEGQGTLGVAFAIAILLNNLEFRFSNVLKLAVILVCFLLTLQCAAKKMNYTYNWWGMDESSLQESVYLSNDIEVFEGIGLSYETLNAYETVYHIVTQNTDEKDSIYCFPQIPSFYYICNRMDPGVRAKVQWFDVASDKSIDNDIKILKNKPPKAIIIYETSEYAYNSHEKLFRAGEISATRKMKQFLLNFATQHGYTFYGRIKSTKNNSLLLYYKTDNDFSEEYSYRGKGTKESPYEIDSVEDLLFLQRSVENGNDYSNVYFIQTKDIDLSSIDNWNPIGKYDSGFYFRGIYDGNGHVIKNMTCIHEGENVGLFGQLGGIVCNLGVINSYVSGSCVGVISSHAASSEAMIINCYTTSSVINGLRAGGIADNFEGKIVNCISINECLGIDAAGAISYGAGYTKNVISQIDGIHTEIINSYGDNSVTYCTQKYMLSSEVINRLNSYIDIVNKYSSNYLEDEQDNDGAVTEKEYDEWMRRITLRYWKTEISGYPTLTIGELK